MSYLASASPAILAISAPPPLEDASESVTAVLAARVEVGDPATAYVTAVNEHALGLDALSRYTGGLCGLPSIGCPALSAGTGLNLVVGDGYALIDGLVRVAGHGTVALPASQARVWLWLRRSGVVVYSTTATRPHTDAIYIGSAVTSGSAITSVNQVEGVGYVRGGALWATYGDAGVPSANGPAGVPMFATTLGGVYLWDGAAWRVMPSAGIDAVPKWIRRVVTFTELKAFGFVDLLASAAGDVVHAARIDVTQAFAAPSLSAAVLSVESDAGATVAHTRTGLTVGASSSAVPVVTAGSSQHRVSVACTGAGYADLTAGSVTVYILASRPS